MLQGGSFYIILLVEIVTLPPLVLFMRRMVCPVLRVMDIKTSRYLCLTIIVMLLLYGASYTQVTFDFDTVVFVFYSLTLCVFGSFGIFFFTARQMNKSRETEEKARQLEHQIELEELNYRNINASIENTRMIRHESLPPFAARSEEMAGKREIPQPFRLYRCLRRACAIRDIGSGFGQLYFEYHLPVLLWQMRESGDYPYGQGPAGGASGRRSGGFNGPFLQYSGKTPITPASLWRRSAG